MRLIYNGEEGDFTDLTVSPEQPKLTMDAAEAEATLARLATLPPRCVLNSLSQNMCVGERDQQRVRTKIHA